MPEKIPTLDFTIPTVDDKLLKDKISNHLNSLEDTEASFANQLRFESFFGNLSKKETETVCDKLFSNFSQLVGEKGIDLEEACRKTVKKPVGSFPEKRNNASNYPYNANNTKPLTNPDKTGVLDLGDK